MRFGVTLLTDLPWAESRPRWIAAEELGLDHAWTYDHLTWGTLPDAPWRDALTTLAAAAALTSRIGLGTAVTAPNFRHPLPLFREVQALDEISEGRFLLGLGVGGDLDAGKLGTPPMPAKERVDRFQEFTDLLLRLRTEDHVDAAGRWFSTVDARTAPTASTPFVVSGNGPRSLRYAARVGDGWMTTGRPADGLDAWFSQLATMVATLEEGLVRAGRDPLTFPRYLLMDAPKAFGHGVFALESPGLFEEMTGRAAALGFTDLVTHWPRQTEPYRGSEQVLEQVCSDVLPRWR
ncbi:LLM class flavin-dependent oxidoreductase [Nocardioides sp. GY 10127]|uniref:LLM class flavin-dependent oxidoreductase n=1 Tax=Nocardioides sp. GY 10127 TaxID=2569762 RepID=UPI0010A773D4|nr:LLM class flavin-dependent oxidoreductase [Nocardioides sp. GY 10127]TIC82746.1 LLM class flavin-dependent oxidoreductase [Nocardioides sp. GY 10127]